ncbi:3452_t:CDS:10 [Entrophospora sp. SA101]|nr:3452_t:CDS:10 [Entrophospora sp. SA101]
MPPPEHSINVDSSTNDINEDDVEAYDETSSLLPQEGTTSNSGKNSTKDAIIELNKEKKLFMKKNIIKLLILVAFISTLIALLLIFRIQDHIKDYLKYIEIHKKYGILIYLTIYIICVWFFLPGSLISIAAGFLFKPSILAGAIIITGDVLAALGTFLFGKYIFSDWVMNQIEKRPTFKALNAVITEEGWKIVVMLRLTPLPFSLISYFFSVSSINLFTFLWATAIGVLPGTFNAVWMGSLVKSLSGIDKPKLKEKDITIITMNFIFVGCCVVALSILGKRSLRKAMIKLEASNNTQNEENQSTVPSQLKSLSGIDKPKLKEKDITIITMNFIFVGCCVVALSILGKRSLRKAMIKLEASNNTQNEENQSTVPSQSNLVEEESIIKTNAGQFTHNWT